MSDKGWDALRPGEDPEVERIAAIPTEVAEPRRFWPKIQTVDWEALRALPEGATPGPWRAVSLSVENDRWTVSRSDNLDPLFQGGRVRAERDAFLIAAAVNYVRALLSATTDAT